MLVRVKTLVVIFAALITTSLVAGTASSAVAAPVSQSVHAEVTMVTKAKPKKKTAPCPRVYYEGSKKRPSKVRLWCNGGKTQITIKTKGLKPGHGIYKKITKGKGKHKHTVRAVVLVKGSHGAVEVRIWYDKPEKCGGGVTASYITIRDLGRQSAKKSTTYAGC